MERKGWQVVMLLKFKEDFRSSSFVYSTREVTSPPPLSRPTRYQLLPLPLRYGLRTPWDPTADAPGEEAAIQLVGFRGGLMHAVLQISLDAANASSRVPYVQSSCLQHPSTSVFRAVHILSVSAQTLASMFTSD